MFLLFDSSHDDKIDLYEMENGLHLLFPNTNPSPFDSLPPNDNDLHLVNKDDQIRDLES